MHQTIAASFNTRTHAYHGALTVPKALRRLLRVKAGKAVSLWIEDDAGKAIASTTTLTRHNRVNVEGLKPHTAVRVVISRAT